MKKLICVLVFTGVVLGLGVVGCSNPTTSSTTTTTTTKPATTAATKP